MANFHKKWRANQHAIRKAIVGLNAAQEHLTALAIMARDNKLHEWNSNGTIQTIRDLKNLVEELEKEL